MNKVLVIAWREFIETVRTRAFFFGVIFMPGLMILLIYGSEKITDVIRHERVAPRTLAVADLDGRVYPELLVQFQKFNKENPQQPFELERVSTDDFNERSLQNRVESGAIYGYVIIPPGISADPGPIPAGAEKQPDWRFRCRLVRKDSQLAASKAVRNALDDAVAAARFRAQDPPIDPQLVKRCEQDVALEDVDVRTGEASQGDDFGRMITPFVMMFLIYLATMSISMGLLTSVLEEKSTRVIEVLLAAVSPMQLMSGKILGIVATGIVMLGIWCAVGYSSARTYQMGHLVTVYRLAIVALYFFPCLLYSAALLAAVGSACNTLKEAQSMSSPLTLFNIVPLVVWPAIVPHPDSALAVALSFVPPITPFVMILRICADPGTPVWQIAATLALMWLTVLGAFWAAAKVFRIGVLMYGQPPTLRELARWVQRA